MNLDNFIIAFNDRNQKLHQSHTQLDSIRQWIYKNPTVVKTIEIGGIMLGAGLLIASPFLYPTMKAGAVVIGIIGGIIAIVSKIAFDKLEIVAPFKHVMTTHTFKTGEFKAAKLYYQGDVPVLELQSDDPYKAGFSHGYLMGASLNQILNRFNQVRAHISAAQPHQIPKTLAAIRDKIPQEYLKELEGMVNGFNKWSKEHSFAWAKKITVDDLLLFHLMPDSIHFDSKTVEGNLHQPAEFGNPKAPHKARVPVLGCTAVVDFDDQEGMTFGRNMDWPSFGIFGSHSLIINRKYSNGKQTTAEVGFPGFAGTLTGMNRQGLSLAMNVCSGDTKKVQGMPAAFYNRWCLENCAHVDDVNARVHQQPPLGAYHLTAADPTTAKAFHFYQGSERNPHVVRRWTPSNPLIVANCTYSHSGERQADMHCSQKRHKIIEDLFRESQQNFNGDRLIKRKIVEASLGLPFVNNDLTTHKVLMNPQMRKMKVAFDNANSGDKPVHELNTEQLFN